MFTTSRRLIIILTAATLTGCVTGGLEPELTRCTFPDSTRTPAPEFICTHSLEGFHLTRLTSVPESDLPTQDRIERGRTEIQQTLTLEWLQSWYSQLQGEDLNIARQVILTWLDEELRVVRTRTSPTGTLWILTGIADREDTVQARLRARLEAAGVDFGER